ncbi:MULTISPECIES: MFS transporter [Arsenicicoccus]|nr:MULTISPECIES: MFS transporter [Arsenicicoccus]
MPARPPLGRDFHLLWAGETVSLVGNATTSILLPLAAVLELQAGPAWMGALAAATWLPWLVIGLPAGAWVDRLDARLTMIVADIAAALTLITVPVAAWLDHLTLPHLVLAALAGGVSTVFFRTAYTTIIPRLVDDAALDTANARLFGTEATAMVVGPSVAARLAAAGGPAFGLAIDAASFLVSAVCLWRIKPGRPVPDQDREGDEGAEGLGARIREGLAFVLRDRYLPWLVVIGGLSNLGLTGYGALLVLYLVRDLGLTTDMVGWYFTTGAIGGVIGSVIAVPLARRIGTGRLHTVALLAAPAALLVGLPTDRSQVWVSAFGYVLVGTCVVGGNVVRASWRQRYVPAEVLGRTVTAMSTVNFGTMPLAGVLAGWLGSTVGVRPTILAMAGLHVVACWLVVASPLVRLRELPARETASV